MGDIDESVTQARALVAETLSNATARLSAGADIAGVERALKKAASYLDYVEAYALLAGAGNREAGAAIAQRIALLRETCDSLAGQDG